MGVGLHAVAGWQRRAAEAAHEASAGGPGHLWTTVTAFGNSKRGSWCPKSYILEQFFLKWKKMSFENIFEDCNPMFLKRNSMC
jgi:hypothetical protein